MVTNIKDLNAEELTLLAATLGKKYGAQLMDPVHKARYFELSAMRGPQGIHVKAVLQNATKSFYYPIEGRIADIDHDMSARDAVFFLFDYIDFYFEEYFSKGDVYLPIDWTEFEYEGLPFQLKGQVYNLHLEHLADQLLGEHTFS